MAVISYVVSDFYWAKYPDNCAWCGIEATTITVDHLIPQSKGGTECTVPACEDCNSTRGAKSPMVFIRYCRDNRYERGDIWHRMLKWHHGGKNELSQLVQKIRDEE